VKGPAIAVHPLTPERWPDFETVMGTNGGVDGCWCMWFRQTSAEYSAGRGKPNLEAMRTIAKEGPPPGLIAYVDGEPAAWCALSPRGDLKRLQRSRITKSLDGADAWAVVCFVTRPEFRGQGLTARLLDAAVEYAKANGAALVEGFPVDAESRVSAGTGYHGFASTFAAAGFDEVARRNPTRPYMRRTIG
jgi:GNAT superfamily N-acetyltransferase